MSNHTITFCQKCGGLIVTPPYSPSEISANYIHVNKACKCAEESAMQSQIVALRDKCAELERSLEAVNEMHEECAEQARTAEAKCAELQHQLDEAAKQETVAYKAFKPKPDGTYSVLLSEQKFNPVGISWQNPLYEHPASLPAIIEQAKAEERESALKDMRKAVIALAHAAESHPEYQAAYEELDAAIRERKP